MTRPLFASLLAPLLAGCGMVHLGGNLSKLPGLPGATESAGSSAGSPSGSSAGPKSSDAELTKLYQSIDYTCCTEGRASGRMFFQKAGVSDTALFKRGNVDPEWIPGWTNDLSTTELTNALAQGAVNRTWQKQCLADYDDYRQGWTAIETKHRPRLAALAKGNYYERAAGLKALLTDVLGDAEQKHLTLHASHPLAWVGLPYEIAVATVQLHRGTAHEVALAEVVSPVRDKIDNFSHFGRPWSEDKELDRDVFCAYAETTGTHRTPKLPDIVGATPGESSPARWPVPAARHQEISKQLKSLEPQSTAALAIPKWEVPTLESGSLSRDPKAPKLVATGPYVVSSIQRDGDKVVIVGEQKSSEPFNYDCRKTGTIASFDLNGNAVPGRDCKVGTKTRVIAAEITFTDVPASIQINKSDEILLYGDVAREEKETPQKQTPSEVVTRRSYAFDGKHLRQVKREGKVVAGF
jgi:hypothetical protein